LRESFDHAIASFGVTSLDQKAAERFACRNYRNHSLLDTLGICLSDKIQLCELLSATQEIDNSFTFNVRPQTSQQKQ
jgi:hypothetical protein